MKNIFSDTSLINVVQISKEKNVTRSTQKRHSGKRRRYRFSNIGSWIVFPLFLSRTGNKCWGKLIGKEKSLFKRNTRRVIDYSDALNVYWNRNGSHFDIDIQNAWAHLIQGSEKVEISKGFGMLLTECRIYLMLVDLIL